MRDFRMTVPGLVALLIGAALWLNGASWVMDWVSAEKQHLTVSSCVRAVEVSDPGRKCYVRWQGREEYVAGAGGERVGATLDVAFLDSVPGRAGVSAFTPNVRHFFVPGLAMALGAAGVTWLLGFGVVRAARRP